MVIFLSGSDDYRRDEKKKFYVSEFQKKYSALGVERIDVTSEGGFTKLEEFVMGQPLFTTNKMAIVENVFQDESYDLKILLQHVAKIGSGMVALMSESEIPGGEWAFLAEAPARHEAFEELSGARLDAFVNKKAQEFGVRLTPQALSFLCHAYEGDTWSLVTELAKASLLGKPQIDVRDLEDLGVEAAPEFFDLLKGFASGSVGTRLATLEKLFAHGEPAAKIFHMLAYKIPEKIPVFAEYDFKVKSGKLDYEEALLDLTIS